MRLPCPSFLPLGVEAGLVDHAPGAAALARALDANADGKRLSLGIGDIPDLRRGPVVVPGDFQRRGGDHLAVELDIGVDLRIAGVAALDRDAELIGAGREVRRRLLGVKVDAAALCAPEMEVAVAVKRVERLVLNAQLVGAAAVGDDPRIQRAVLKAAVLQEVSKTRTLRKISASSTRSIRVGSFSVQNPVVVTARP